ncbi:MAG: hypothetical protein GX913_02325 [Clostridiales bacterium]|nr:hypothetical protein [Clostridiales bacterium]
MENSNVLAGNVEFLKDAVAVLDELSKAKESRDELSITLKRIERDIASEEKVTSDTTDITIKKRKEEIADSFDKEIERDQEKLKRAKANRDKAKGKEVAGRIVVETADVKEENRQIEVEIRTLLKEGRLPRFCNTKFYCVLFYPKGFLEYLSLCIFHLILFFVIPFGVFYFIPTEEPLWLAVIYFVIITAFLIIYNMVNNYTKVTKWAYIRQMRALRDKIKANRKKIKAIKNAIRKDRNEKDYNLEAYDTEILELENEIKKTVAEKQEALTTFEETTKNVIVEEIANRNRELIANLKQEFGENSSHLKEKEALIKDVTKHLTSNYEVFLGKEFVNYERLNEMISIMESGRASTVSEALTTYKSEH